MTTGPSNGLSVGASDDGDADAPVDLGKQSGFSQDETNPTWIETKAWVEAVTGDTVAAGASFGERLKDGTILCRLINALKPGTIPKVYASRMPFKQMENINSFLRACRAMGVADHDCFETVDLFEQKNIGAVVRCLHALGQVAVVWRLR